MTNSAEPEVRAARAYFDQLLTQLPAPRLDHDGAPNEKNDPAAKRERRQKKKAKGD